MTFTEARWGLLLIAEEGFGRRIRQAEVEEDQAMKSARAALGG